MITTTLKYVVSLFVFISIYHLIKNKDKIKESLLIVSPYFSIGLLLALCLSSYYTLSGIGYNENVSIMATNLFQVTRNSVLAVAGVILFSHLGIKDGFVKINDFGSYYKNVNIKSVVSVSLYYTLFVFTLFIVTNQPFVFNKNEVVSLYFSSILAAVVEEMIVRIFIIALLLKVLNDYRHKWLIAIVLSSVFWTLLHLQNEIQIWVRIIQVFPMGMVLGYIMKVYGFNTCLYIHVLSNTLVISLMYLIAP